ncbi:VOC family protein [Mycolicibacterium phlei]
MPSPIRAVLVETTDPGPLTRFWSQLLGRAAAADAVLLDGGQPLRFTRTESPKRVKNRLHLDLASRSPEHQQDLVRTARELGAEPVDIGQGLGQNGVPWVVLADPGGNEFCVLEPRDEYRGTGPVAAVVFDALDPVAQARFWSELTGLPVTREHPDYASLRQPAGFFVEFVRVGEPKTVRNRVHLTLQDPPRRTDPEGNEIMRG